MEGIPANEQIASPRRAPSQQRSRERVERMLAAASALIAEQGSDAVRMGEVAERAGVSIGSLYQFFPDKRAIIWALAERYTTEGQACISAALAGVRERLSRGRNRVDDEVVDLALFLRLHPGVGVKRMRIVAAARNLAGDLAGQVGDVERFDPTGAAASFDETRPRRLDAAGERRHHPHPRDDNPSHFGPQNHDARPRTRQRRRTWSGRRVIPSIVLIRRPSLFPGISPRRPR